MFPEKCGPSWGQTSGQAYVVAAVHSFVVTQSSKELKKMLTLTGEKFLINH